MSEDTNYPFHAMIIKGGPAELKAIAHLVASYRDNGVAPSSCNLRTLVCADGSHQR